MSNKYSSAYSNLSEEVKDKIVGFYLAPNSQARVASEFDIPLHSTIKVLRERNVIREKYGDTRNKMVSLSNKSTLASRPEIVQQRIAQHTGSKRSLESRVRMQEAAWERLSKYPSRYVSKIETKFGEFLARKLGVTVVAQYRVQGKPFDFLIDNKLLLEFDGPHHYNPDYFLWKNNKDGFIKQQVRDVKRFQIAKQANMPLMVITNKEVNKHGELNSDLLHAIMHHVGYNNA